MLLPTACFEASHCETDLCDTQQWKLLCNMLVLLYLYLYLYLYAIKCSAPGVRWQVCWHLQLHVTLVIHSKVIHLPVVIYSEHTYTYTVLVIYSLHTCVHIYCTLTPCVSHATAHVPLRH